MHIPHIYLSIYLPTCLPAYLPTYLSIYLYVCLSIYRPAPHATYSMLPRRKDRGSASDGVPAELPRRGALRRGPELQSSEGGMNTLLKLYVQFLSSDSSQQYLVSQSTVSSPLLNPSFDSYIYVSAAAWPHSLRRHTP